MDTNVIILSSVSLIVIILLFIAYTSYKTKRMLRKAIDNESY